jgi:hypothetical protein
MTGRRVLAALAVTALAAGCLRPAATYERLIAQRAETRAKRTTATVGVIAGIAIGVAGGVLLSRAADLRSRESSGDDEDGLVELLGGVLLLPAGVGITVTSGVLVGVRAAELRDLDAALARMPPGPPAPAPAR